MSAREPRELRMSGRIECEVRVRHLRFGVADGQPVATFRGRLVPFERSVPRPEFEARALYHSATRSWSMDASEVRCGPVNLAGARELCQRLVSVLRATWLSRVPHDPNDGPEPRGARVKVGRSALPTEEEDRAFAIYRAGTVDLCRPEWGGLWKTIQNRVEKDPEFSILGIPRDDARGALARLAEVFPEDWVRCRHKDVAGGRDPGMWGETETDPRFPALLLARTALGGVCRDPGWNALVSIAHACEVVDAYPNGRSLVRRAGKSHGHLLQIAFAGHVADAGLLREIEPPTHNGSTKYDFALAADGLLVDVEMKAISSKEAGRNLGDEILETCRKIPKHPARPVVFLVVLLETDMVASERERLEGARMVAAASMQALSSVSAVVVGSVFVDSSGGPLRWAFEEYLISPTAASMVTEGALRSLFAANDRATVYPMLPLRFLWRSKAAAPNDGKGPGASRPGQAP